MNDWDVRARDYDSVFATVKFYQASSIGSMCLQAITQTTRAFHASFPGWPLYRRLVTGDPLLDRVLMAYAIGMGRALAKSHTKTGREYIGASFRGGWMRQAALDGLHFAIVGSFPVGLHERAREFDVSNKTYQKVRDPVGGGIRSGVEMWRAELHARFTQIILGQKYPAEELVPE